MLDSGDGSGGGPGSLSYVIAASAAESELIHEGWDDVGGGRVSKDCEYGAMGHVRTKVTIDTWTADWEYETTGGTVPDDILQGYVSQAKQIIAKWPPKIQGLFEKWKDIPSGYEISGGASGLEWAVKELAIDASDSEKQGTELVPANTRLAGDISRLVTRTSQLSGQYARTFADYYVADLAATIENQGMLVGALSVSATAQGEIWQRTNADLTDLEVMAHEAMIKARPSANSDGLIMALTVVGAIAGAVASVPTLGGSAVLIAALGGAAAIGAEYEDAKEAKDVKVPLGASHPNDVYTNLKEALEELDRRIEQQEKGLASWLTSAKNLADGGQCDLKDPELNTAPPGQVLTKEQDVVVTPGVIAEITEMWLPSVAGDLQQAQKELTITKTEGFERTTDVGLAPAGAWTEFSGLQTRTSFLLTDTAGDLERAAEALQSAARGIGLADEDQNQVWERRAKQVEEQNINDSDDVRALP
jgi:hypothetical protein